MTVDTSTRRPELSELFSRSAEATAAGLHACKVAKIVRYDANKRQCDAQPLIKNAYLDEDETRQVEDIPIICNVPVRFPCGGGLSITWPLVAGDVVVLLCSDQSLDSWLAQGGSVDPGDERKHSINDCIAVPGIFDFAHAPAGSTAGFQIGTDGGAFQGVAVGGTNYDAFMAALKTHTHPVSGALASASADLSPLTVPATSATVKVTP